MKTGGALRERELYVELWRHGNVRQGLCRRKSEMRIESLLLLLRESSRRQSYVIVPAIDPRCVLIDLYRDGAGPKP